MSAPQTRPLFDGVDKTLLQMIQIIKDLEALVAQTRGERDQYQSAIEVLSSEIKTLKQAASDMEPVPSSKRALRSVPAEEGVS